MGLDLWFRADVARILQAAHEAMCSTAAAMGDRGIEDIGARERAAGYRQGFGAALRAVSTAFGLTEIDGERGGVVIDGVARHSNDLRFLTGSSRRDYD